MRPALSFPLILALWLPQAAVPGRRAQTPQPGQPPQAAPKNAAVEFVDVTKAAGLSWGFRTLAPGARYIIETMGGGGGFVDYNNDGLLDIYLVCYTQTPQSDAAGRLRDALYRNNGDGTFTDVTDKAGISDSMWGMGLAVGDYDNDGYEDLYVTGYGASKLYRNNRDGTFAEVALESDAALDPDGNARGGMGVDATDVDGDGLLDLFVTNFSGQTNALFRNAADGTFTEETYPLGLGRVSIPLSGFGTKFFDYDDDGRTELFVLNGHPFEPIAKVFPDVTYAEPPFLFERAGRAFRDVAAEHGAALKRFYLGRGLAVGDYDNDGDPDLLLLNAAEPPVLLRNDGGNRNRWLGVRLVGAKSNRDGVGARVTVSAGGARRSKHLLGGASYLSASGTRDRKSTRLNSSH